MDTDLRSLFERFNAGDEEAAAELVRRYATYVRVVIGRQLTRRQRARFDSEDVVQSLAARLLRDVREKKLHFDTPEQFRRFLVLVARNRLLNRLRHDRHSLREQPLPPSCQTACPQPLPDESAQADDLWQQMLRLCPPEHHQLLWLKREGLTTEEMARRVGLHPSSVRRIFYDLARRLAAQGAT
jgi:RNA polymerase sigma-70 factor (ECF subfamily)